MIPIGYMAKNVRIKPDWLQNDNVKNICSLSNCISTDFVEYINHWKHNGYWLFNSPDIIQKLAKDTQTDISGTKTFYYEVYEKQYNNENKNWESFSPEKSFNTDIKLPNKKTCLGYDITSFSAQTSHECSPLSCNNLAEKVEVNENCLLPSVDIASELLTKFNLDNFEPGPYRIIAVYEV